jgi:FMN phosphatase YigB (HAD superfamily)
VIKALVSDFSRTILFVKDSSYQGTLNGLYKELSSQGLFEFWDYFELNEPLLDIYKSLDPSIKKYIFTTGKIQNDSNLLPYLSEIFNEILTIGDVGGLEKSNSKSYVNLVNLIQINPSDCLFVDDERANIDAAKSVGINTILYTNIKDFGSQLSQFELIKPS